MPDIEKVIKGIECSLNHHTEICEECPYYDLFKQEKHCGRQLKLDAIALLKEQPDIVYCKDCKHYIHLRTDPGYCARDGSRWIFRDLDWFCAGGERKDGET